MGLVDDVTTSTLHVETKYEKKFPDWLRTHIKRLEEQHLNFDPMITTLDKRMQKKIFLINKKSEGAKRHSYEQLSSFYNHQLLHLRQKVLSFGLKGQA